MTISNSNKNLIFIGLNPSLSNSYFLDNTTKKIIKISARYKYGKLKIINLFGLISKDPKRLFLHKDPVGRVNNKIIKGSLQYWSMQNNCHIWIGWGNNGIFLDRHKYVNKLLKDYFYLKSSLFNNPVGPLLIKKTKLNNPVHPLYCRDDAILKDIYSINKFNSNSKAK